MKGLRTAGPNQEAATTVFSLRTTMAFPGTISRLSGMTGIVASPGLPVNQGPRVRPGHRQVRHPRDEEGESRDASGSGARGDDGPERPRGEEEKGEGVD